MGARNTKWLRACAKISSATVLGGLIFGTYSPILPAAAYTTAANILVTEYAFNFFPEGFNSGVGPVGLAFDSGGNLFVANYNDGYLYEFPPGGGGAGFAGIRQGRVGHRSAGLAFSKDLQHLYLARQGDCCVPGDLVEVDLSTLQPARTVALVPGATGLATDPLTGDLFVSGNGTISRISDFATGPGTVTTYANVAVDGIAFGADGTLYGAGRGGTIYFVPGSNVSSTSPWPGTPVFTVLTSAGQPAPIDGIGIGAGPDPRNPPFIYVNRNDGVITKVDLTTSPPSQSDIVTGGTRGDFVTVNSQGCLFATQSMTVNEITDAAGNCNPPLVPTAMSAPAVTLTKVNADGESFYSDTFIPTRTETLQVTTSGQLATANLYVDGVSTTNVVSGGAFLWTPPRKADGTPWFASHTLVVRGTDTNGAAVASAPLTLYSLVRVQADGVSILPNGAVPYNPFAVDLFEASCLNSAVPTPQCFGQPPFTPVTARFDNRLTLEGKSDGTAFVAAPRAITARQLGQSLYCDDPQTTPAVRTDSLQGPFTDGSFTGFLSSYETRVNLTLPDVFRVPTPPGTTGPTNQSDFVPWNFSTIYAGIAPDGTTTVKWSDATSHASIGNSLFPYHYLYKDGAGIGRMPHPVPDLAAWTRSAAASPQRILDLLYVGMGASAAWILQHLLNTTAPDLWVSEHLFAAERAECARQRFARIYQTSSNNLEDYLQRHFPGLPLWAPFAQTLKSNLLPHYNAHEFAQGISQTGFVRDPACVVPGCPGKERMKVIGVFSPVRVDVYDAAGHHSGPLPDGTIEQGMAAVTYLTIGHGTFLVLPNDPAYRVQLTGTGSGTFTVNATDFDGQNKLEFRQYYGVAVTPNSRGSLVMGSTGTPLNWDLNGTGTTTALTATTRTTSPASDTTDTSAPMTTASLQGATGQPGFFRSAVNVSLAASDNLSGVARTEYSLDNGSTWTLYAVPSLHFGSDGSYHLLYRSTDVAGNQESARSVDFVIDTVPPTTSATMSPAPPPPGAPSVTLSISNITVTPGGSLPPFTCYVTSAMRVALSAADNQGGAGVQEIDYTLSGAQSGSGTFGAQGGTVPITADGTTTLTYFAIDKAGNREPPHVVSVFVESRAGVACTPAPMLATSFPPHATVSVSGTLTVNGTSRPFSRTFSY